MIVETKTSYFDIILLIITTLTLILSFFNPYVLKLLFRIEKYLSDSTIEIDTKTE